MFVLQWPGNSIMLRSTTRKLSYLSDCSRSASESSTTPTQTWGKAKARRSGVIALEHQRQVQNQQRTSVNKMYAPDSEERRAQLRRYMTRERFSTPTILEATWEQDDLGLNECNIYNLQACSGLDGFQELPVITIENPPSLSSSNSTTSVEYDDTKPIRLPAPLITLGTDIGEADALDAALFYQQDGVLNRKRIPNPNDVEIVSVLPNDPFELDSIFNKPEQHQDVMEGWESYPSVCFSNVSEEKINTSDEELSHAEDRDGGAAGGADVKQLCSYVHNSKYYTLYNEDTYSSINSSSSRNFSSSESLENIIKSSETTQDNNQNCSIEQTDINCTRFERLL